MSWKTLKHLFLKSHKFVNSNNGREEVKENCNPFDGPPTKILVYKGIKPRLWNQLLHNHHPFIGVFHLRWFTNIFSYYTCFFPFFYFFFFLFGVLNIAFSSSLKLFCLLLPAKVGHTCTTGQRNVSMPQVVLYSSCSRYLFI